MVVKTNFSMVNVVVLVTVTPPTVIDTVNLIVVVSKTISDISLVMKMLFEFVWLAAARTVRS